MHAGRGKVTLQRLALELGLSTATVSLALRDSPVVAEATRQKVQDVARARGYVANRGAASLRTARTNIIGVGLHDIINPSFTELLAALEDALSTAGKTVLLGVGQEDVARQTQVLGTLAEYRPDAFIVSPAAGTGVHDLRALAATGIAVVQVTREVEGSGFDLCRLGRRDRCAPSRVPSGGARPSAHRHDRRFRGSLHRAAAVRRLQGRA